MSGAEEDFLSGGGELGALIRAKDWSATALGPIAAWPQSLRSAVSILLPSKAQISLFWGPDLVTLYNDAYRPVFGGKHPQALGQPIREAWSELWRDGLKELFENVLVTGEAFWAKDRPFYMERHGYPEETFFDVSYDPVRDESGKVGGVFCIVSETTGRVLGERRLKLLRDLAAVPARATSVTEACELSLELLDAAALDIPFAQIDLEDAHAWPVGLHALPELEGRVPGAKAGPWPEPATRLMVLPISERAGEPAGKIALGISSRLSFDDEYRGFFELVAGQVAASIAAARAAEEERRRAEALAEIDRAKTAFFSNVSHEFRTPLTLMLGPVEDALADAQALPPAQRERLELVRRSGLRLQKLVNSLLDFSRIEAGRAQASYEPTELGALTADLASSFRSAVEKAGLSLVVDCAPVSQPAYVDRDMWEKIVLNLLSNAFKFTFEGRIKVSLREERGLVVLAVSDTGTGIPEADLPHVFERFRRVEGARSRTHEGTGIGLALVKELVKLHAGEITAESAEGRGSTFTVTIPTGTAHLPAERIGRRSTLAPTSLGAAPFVEEALRWLPGQGGDGSIEEALHQKPDAGPRPRLVWADDNADMREYVRRLLASHYEVEAVPDGEAALAAVRRQVPHLVLADVMMPRLDGFGLLAALRADKTLARVPVILLSARAGEEARVEGLKAGADDYLVKPFSARELLARVAARLELSQARERARLSDELLRTFADTAPAILWTTDPQGRCTFLSRGWYDFTAQSEVESMGFGWKQALHPDDREMAQGKLMEANAARRPFSFDFRVRRHDGEYRWAIVSARPRFGADGEFLGFVGSVIDVHERKRVEQALAESEARYRDMFQSAGVSIWEEDFTAVVALVDAMKRQGVTDFRAHLAAHPRIVREAIGLVKVIDVNAASLRLFGARDKAQLLDSLPRIFTPQTEAVFADQMVAIAEGRSPVEGEAQLRTLGGARVDVLVTVALPRPGGRADRVLVTLTDITERKRAEEALREADRRKEEFLTILSHELRNPLAPIRNAVALLQNAGQNDAIRAQSVAILERQVSHLIRLVDDLLDVTRINRGEVTLQQAPVRLADLLAAAVETARPALQARQHELEVDPPPPKLAVRGDAVRLSQVMANILNNAATYTPPGGRIEVTAGREGGEAVVRVRDNGTGMTAETLKSLFDLFIRGENARQHPGGFGVGLALARRLVEMHGGRIEAASEGPGLGAELTVRLPLSATEPVSPDEGLPGQDRSEEEAMNYREAGRA